MFENRVLNRIFGPKKDEVTGEWRELYNYMTTKFFWVINSRSLRLARHVACVGESFIQDCSGET